MAVEIRTDFVELATKYAGRWVAIHPDTREVVADAATALEVFEAAARAGVDEPFITQVLDDYGVFVP